MIDPALSACQVMYRVLSDRQALRSQVMLYKERQSPRFREGVVVDKWVKHKSFRQEVRLINPNFKPRTQLVISH